MGFVVPNESTLRPRAYFSRYGLTHNLRASYTAYLYALLTSHADTLVPTLGFCPLPGWLPNWSRPCTLMGFMVATESALDLGLTSAFMGLHTAFRPLHYMDGLAIACFNT